MTRSVPSASRSMRSTLPRTATRARSRLPSNVERPFELVFEQPLDHADALLDLDGERPLGETRRGRRAEQIGALERAVPLRQARAAAASATSSKSARASSRLSVVHARNGRARATPDRTPRTRRAAAGHARAASARIRPRAPPRGEHLRGEVLERTFEIALDVADRVDARRPRPDGAVIARDPRRRP